MVEWLRAQQFAVQGDHSARTAEHSGAQLRAQQMWLRAHQCETDDRNVKRMIVVRPWVSTGESIAAWGITAESIAAWVGTVALVVVPFLLDKQRGSSAGPP